MSTALRLEHLTRADRTRLVPDMARIVRLVFTHPSSDHERRYIDSLSGALQGRGWLVCYESSTGQLAGFNLITLDDVDVDGTVVTCISSTALLSAAVSGNNRTLLDAMKLMAGHLWRHPSRRLYFVSMITSPRPYALMADAVPNLSPSWRRPALPRLEATLIEAMIVRRGLKRSAVPGIVSENGTPRLYRPGNARNRSVQFFESRVPNFSKGDALCVCARISWRTLAIGATGQAKRAWSRAVANRGIRASTASSD